MGPLVNSLADDRIRGRANSISGFTSSLALIVSPAIATGLIAAGGAAVWIGLLCLGCLGCLGTIAIGAQLRHYLTPEQEGVQAASVAAAPQPAPAAQRPDPVVDQPLTPFLDGANCR